MNFLSNLGIGLVGATMTDRLRALMQDMDKDELFKALYTDVLTGVYNRRAFEAERIVELEPFVAIVDVDSLKWVNDTLGYRMGDAMLCSVAITLSAIFDKVYRLSGDEFVVAGEDLVDLIRSVDAAQDAAPYISYGIGKDLIEANDRLKMSKKTRERTNLRSPRGVEPPWMEQWEGIL